MSECHTTPTRRSAIRAGAAALLTAGLWPGALRAADAAAGEAFNFLCVNDLHCQDEESGRWLESRVIRQMSETKEKVDFCLILGDLAENGTPAEFGMVSDSFKKLGIPIYVVPGNHDFAADQSRAAFDDLFPRSLNYTFEHKGWQFVGLDTTAGTAYKAIDVGADTLAWMDQNLPKLDTKRPTAVFTHFPLGDKVTYRPKNADAVLSRFLKLNLQTVCSGHYHADTERTFQGAPLTTSRCCALKRNNHDKSPDKGYSLYQAKDGKLSRRFIAVPTKA